MQSHEHRLQFPLHWPPMIQRRYPAHRAEAPRIALVLVLNSERCPDAPPDQFQSADQEGEALLVEGRGAHKGPAVRLVGQQPSAAQQHIQRCQEAIAVPREEAAPRLRRQAEIHREVPAGRVDRGQEVAQRPEDRSLELGEPQEPGGDHRQRAHHDGQEVLPTVQPMAPLVPGVMHAPEALGNAEQQGQQQNKLQGPGSPSRTVLLAMYSDLAALQRLPVSEVTQRVRDVLQRPA
mmetsp:Transcript_34383/g.82492  ORF Transcript_34383/g.82492 Transcript_34383/m.82492 type:complete len:235 (+) Transcript_34383:237-941(+)